MLAWDQDTEYVEYVVEKAETGDDVHMFMFHGGWMTGCDADLPYLPQEGERIRLYPGQIGSQNRGLATYRDGEWHCVWYCNPTEQEIENQIWIAERRLKNLQALKQDIHEREQRIEALPEPFKRRLRHFIEIGGYDYRANSEVYELFVCEEAVKMINTLETEERIQAFYKATWDEQCEMLPTLDRGHSGNTFGSACRLARLYVTGNISTIYETDYGALAPLHGSYQHAED